MTKSLRQATGQNGLVEVKLGPHDNKDSDSRSMLMHEQAARVFQVDFERMEDSSKRLLEG